MKAAAKRLLTLDKPQKSFWAQKQEHRARLFPSLQPWTQKPAALLLLSSAFDWNLNIKPYSSSKEREGTVDSGVKFKSSFDIY